MHTFMRVVMTGVCLSAGMMISAEAGETKAKREKAKGEVNGEFDEMKGEAKAVQEELKGNDTKAELELHVTLMNQGPEGFEKVQTGLDISRCK